MNNVKFYLILQPNKKDIFRTENNWLSSVSQSVFCGTSTYCVLNTVPPIEDDHGNSNSSHVKIFLPKKLLECLPKCSSLPKERHRWNTNEALTTHLFMVAAKKRDPQSWSREG
uniref:Calmodulin binding transcription activator 1 n=3 Tax=Platyrrhini TaxID=9479 RepID=F7FA65_CALJA